MSEQSSSSSGAAAPAVPDDRGFVLTIKGYTVNGGNAMYNMPGEYARKLEAMAPKDGPNPKPYWFEAIRDGTKGDPDVFSPWGSGGSGGSGRGTWWSDFAEDLANIKPEDRPSANLGAGGPAAGGRTITDLADVDVFQLSAAGLKPPSMKANFRFILTVKVHLRDTAGK